MDWRDEGILLTTRPHGENGTIIETLTREHGRHSGLVHGGQSASKAPMMQPGTQLALQWRARLAEHLGNFHIEPVRSRAALIMSDRVALAGLNSVGALLVALLPEREPATAVYNETVALADALAEQAWDWPARYARWETNLLTALGFGLDLSRCAATGATTDLVYVSPRSGRAVSRGAGGAFADRLLPLPGFLIGQGRPTIGAVREALRLTGYFLEHRVCPAFEQKALPEPRARLLRLLKAHVMTPPENEAAPAPRAQAPRQGARG
ncbi:MAG TPA: DNA repair protein RecO [Thermohalobaculum sp.]|nr:DNA repair protein RecO [Thermohalobaculum sp.]